MTDKEKIRNIIELFIAWNGETDVIDVANIDSAVEFIADSLQEEPVSNDFEMALAEMIDNAQKRVVEPRVVAAQWKDELIKLAKSEEPISEELEEAAWQYYDRNKPLMPPELDLHKELIDFFKAGARWKEQNYSNLSEVLDRDNLDEIAEEYSSCTYLEEVLGEGDREVLKARLNNTFKAGAKWKEEKMMANATDVTVHIDAGGYPYTPEIELYDYDKDVPLAKEGDKYKVVLIKDK